MAVSVPIKKVTPADARGNAAGTAVTTLPPLAKADWSKQDLSADGAGRLESGRMVKKRVAKSDRIDLEWSYITRAEAAAVLQAFDSEYVLVEYLDAKLGDWRTEHFYTGDMSCTGWTPHLDSWERVSFAIIRATPDKG
jgi:hypothetical protein